MKKTIKMDPNKYQEMNDGRLKKGIKVLQHKGPVIFGYKLALYLKRCSLRIIAPLILPTIPKLYFKYNGKKLEYFYHRKNLAWTNERAIEIPIVMEHIQNSPAQNILEVGAVLPHYYPNLKHDVVDKFEKSAGVINEDIVNFRPSNKYSLIVSISTLEHVGFDDDVKDDEGILKALKNLKSNCLKESGKMIITLPINYNKSVDQFLFESKLGFCEEHFFKKQFFNRWVETTREEAKSIKHGELNPKAIVVGVIKQK